jgi:hypothetical protein
MDKIWWNQVTNATRFIDDIVESVTEGKSVILALSDNVPWYNTMRELVEDDIRKRSSERTLISLIDSADEPGRIILNKFCKKEKRDDYRPAMGYAGFLAKSDDIVLNDRFVWVSGIPNHRYDDWIEFVENYGKCLGKDKKGGIFILELKHSQGINGKKGIQEIYFDKEIGQFDQYVFNMLASSSAKESAYLRQYLSELVSDIVGNDIELCACCIQRYKKFLTDPYRTLQSITSEEIRSNGDTFNVSLSDDEVKMRTWKAQIKTIFPLIEEFRGTFVNTYKKQIENKLPISNTFGETFGEVNEVEIGTLYHMVCSETIQVSSEYYHRLKLFKEARNRLAHLVILNQTEIEAIFEVL